MNDQGLFYLLSSFNDYILTDYQDLQNYLNSGYKIIDASYDVNYLQSLVPSGSSFSSTLNILGTTIQTGISPIIQTNYLPLIILLGGIYLIAKVIK